MGSSGFKPFDDLASSVGSLWDSTIGKDGLGKEVGSFWDSTIGKDGLIGSTSDTISGVKAAREMEDAQRRMLDEEKKRREKEKASTLERQRINELMLSGMSDETLGGGARGGARGGNVGFGSLDKLGG